MVITRGAGFLFCIMLLLSPAPPLPAQQDAAGEADSGAADEAAPAE
jgi:hypothetical protein